MAIERSNSAQMAASENLEREASADVEMEESSGRFDRN